MFGHRRLRRDVLTQGLATKLQCFKLLLQRTYGRDIHVLPSWSGNKEVDAHPTLDHLTRKLFETRMLRLKQLLFGLNSMQIILVSQEQPAWAPCW